MILSPNSNNFRRFGKIISYPHKSLKKDKRNLWRIVHREPGNAGWRIAYLVLRDKTIGRLECHPDSDESFEPIKGRSLIFISKDKNFKNIYCFRLDKPLIVYKGVWHGLITLSPETEIKITENARLQCRYWPFGFRINSLSELNSRLKQEKL